MAAFGNISWQEALRASRVLFGPSFAEASLASGIWRRDLKRAFRRRAMETHPDRARALGRAERDLAREFDAVRAAYGLLASLEASPPRPRSASPAPNPPRQARPREARTPPPPPAGRPERDRAIPARRLRLAEFLYYAGRVPWSAWVGSVAWQRAQRPALGRIAVQMGFLSPRDVLALLTRRRAERASGVPFGTYAVGRGALTAFQRLAALGRQARMQRPIGGFFVEKGMLRAEELDALHRAMLRHNALHPAA